MMNERNSSENQRIRPRRRSFDPALREEKRAQTLTLRHHDSSRTRQVGVRNRTSIRTRGNDYVGTVVSV